MKAAILTMFTGLSPTYSLVNVAADQIRMLLDAGIEVRMLVSETCPDRERTGIFLDPRVEWVRVVNTRQGSPITWYDYSGSIGRVHDSFFEEADLIARDLVRCLDGVDFCLMHDILYQGWHLVHNIAVRKAQEQLPGVRFVEFTHSLPLPRPEKMVYPMSARFTGMSNTRFSYPTRCGLPALARQYDIPESTCAVVNNTLPLLERADPAVRTVACSMDLSEKEILIVCPGRLTPAKRFEKAAMLAGAIRTVSGKEHRAHLLRLPQRGYSGPRLQVHDPHRGEKGRPGRRESAVHLGSGLPGWLPPAGGTGIVRALQSVPLSVFFRVLRPDGAGSRKPGQLPGAQ